jgi:hypothetical protein
MNVTLKYLSEDGSGPAALRIVLPQNDIRTPTHFIALIDVSMSMEENSKLKHVKHCMSLLLPFLTAEDALSIVTFGDTSTIVLNHIKTDSQHRPLIEKAIDSLVIDGSTNYSAGLGSVRQILGVGSPLKPGLMTFTDGHANCGVSEPEALIHMISRIHELYPTLSMSFVAYGTDHNATLLKTMADSVMGSYSIVNSLEGAATAMGDCLGGILSCAVQNVVVECPPGTRVHGPYTVSGGRLVLGDLCSGSDTMILFEIPAGPVVVTGVALPSLDPFRMVATTSLDTSPNVEITVTRLRYRCADLFHQIRDSMGRNANFTAEIAAFREACADPTLAEHPVMAMLKTEILSMEAAAANIALGATGGLDAQLTQHAAFASLMRGTTTTIRSQAGRHVHFDSDAEDPEENVILMSPMRSTRQQNVSDIMRSSSGGGRPGI